MGLLVLSLSVPEFYLTKDKSTAVDDQVETKTIEKACIEENTGSIPPYFTRETM
jgi:hypothetical protein